MSKICAGIVLYNPELQRLLENINAIINQVEMIVIVDNASSNIEDIEGNILNHKKIVLIKNDRNEGIAKALNQILQEAKKYNYDWTLTLDQDTVCPLTLIEEYKKYLTFNERLGIICPFIADINVITPMEVSLRKSQKPKFIDRCITSGSLTNVKVWEQIGGFDEQMFIDYVDFEYCKRMQINQYKILLINDIFIYHEVGKCSKVKIGPKDFIINNHSVLRKYYYFRNRIYTYRKHREYFNLIEELLKLIKCICLLLFEKNGVKKVFTALRGITDGFKMPIKIN